MAPLPLHIEEDHHHVLEHILSGIGAKKLPFSGNLLVHWDSHPDLLLPRKLPAALCMDKRALLDSVSIENWILPCAYLGVINKIVWVCPPWAKQMGRGLHKFLIGKHKETSFIRVTSTESYFLSEGITCREEELEDTKVVEILVHELGCEKNPPDTEDLFSQFVRDSPSVILDFDLDFYSTKNPFLALHAKAGLYDKLKDLYIFEPVPENLNITEKNEFALKSCENRTQLLDELQSVFAHLDRGEDLDSYRGIGTKHLRKICDIKTAIESKCDDDPVDWLLIHDAGCTCDNTDLPHHVSSHRQITSLFQETSRLLDITLPMKSIPKMITAARSAEDDFCPKDQVEGIQTELINLLKTRFIELKVYYNYKD